MGRRVPSLSSKPFSSSLNVSFEAKADRDVMEASRFMPKVYLKESLWSRGDRSPTFADP